MSRYLIVGAGGSLGAVARYAAGAWVAALGGSDPSAFPWTTLAVNVTGSFAIGVFLALFASRRWSDGARLFVAVGFLGGYTTFSTFAWEFLGLLRGGETDLALAYVAASVALGFAAVALGVGLGGWIESARRARERGLSTRLKAV